jgi:hypothetical protein
VVLADHLVAGLVQSLDGVGVRSHLRLKRLVLLDLGLKTQIANPKSIK